MGGSSNRMAAFAEMIAKAIGHHQTEKEHLNLSQTDRYSLYKIGPVISVNVRIKVGLLTFPLMYSMVWEYRQSPYYFMRS